MKNYVLLASCVITTTLMCSREATELLTPLPERLSLFHMNRKVESSRAPRPIGPYSQAIQVSTPRFVFVSGQIPLDAETGTLITEVEAATHKVLNHIREILQAANMDFANIVKSTIYLTNMNDFATVNRIYQDYFKHVATFPARETVQVAALPKGACVEISVIAAE